MTMITAMLRELTYANVMATLAFFVAVGGVSYAATKLPAHRVGSKTVEGGERRPDEAEEWSRGRPTTPEGLHRDPAAVDRIDGS
jgi:hypothetical protein